MAVSRLNINICVLLKLMHLLQLNSTNNKYHQIFFVGSPNVHITNPRGGTAAILKNRKPAVFRQWFARAPQNIAE